MIQRPSTGRRGLIVATAAGFAMPSVLRAQGTWPDRPIRISAPFPSLAASPPGTSVSAVSRYTSGVHRLAMHPPTHAPATSSLVELGSSMILA